MKKIIFTLVSVCVFQFGKTQTGTQLDMETYVYCLTDSVNQSTQRQIFAVMDVNTKQVKYYNDHNLSSPYTVSGTLLPCFDVVGVSECRLRSVSNSSNKRKWSLTISDVSSYHNDIFLVGLNYEDFLGMGAGPGRNNARIPLNYPYGNTTAEGNRFAADIKNWLDCKGIHYIDTSTWGKPGVYALDIQVHTVRNNFDINTDLAYYSLNLKDPNPAVIAKTGSNTVVNSISTFEVCEVYRKEKNGAVYYIMPYYNTSPIYPNAADFGLLDRRIDCNYQTNRADDCDRPASQNCYLAKSDSSLCTYYLLIPTKDTVTNIWANGSAVPINGSYFATVQPDQKQLQDTLQKWLAGTNKYGRVSIENTKNAAADGWVFTIIYTDVVFDSVQTNRGKYYFSVTDCKDYLYYDVTRNELGGIINTLDQFGKNVIAPPPSSNMIPCDQMEHIGGCRYQGKSLGASYAAGPIILDLSKYSSISITQTQGSGTLTIDDLDGSGTAAVTLYPGNSFQIKSEQKCKYLSKQNLRWDNIGNGSAVNIFVTY